jgi:hypothetical protein
VKGNSEARITRRRFLTSVAAVAGVSIAGSLVAACGGGTSAPAATTAPAKTEGTQAAGSAPTPTAEVKLATSGEKKLAVWQTKLFHQAANDDSAAAINKYAQDKGWTAEIS